MKRRIEIDLTRKWVLIVAVAFVCALGLSAARAGREMMSNLAFHLRIFDVRGEHAGIRSSIQEYNRYSASFYNSGGVMAGLEDIPAAPLVKRRLFKDINMLKGDGYVMVFDRDRSEVRTIYFLDRDTAVAESFEVWAVALQEYETRMPVFNVKAVEAGVRYLLRRESFPGSTGRRWIVYAVDVYAKDAPIPQLRADII